MIKFIFTCALLCAALLEGQDRRSSSPYISGDTFRTFCKFAYDELGKSFDPAKVEEGDTIFVKTDFIDEFFLLVHPQIKVRYILVSHNSDCHVETRFVKYMDDGKVIAWFGQNVEASHPRIHPIPIGIANRCWPHGNVDIVFNAQQAALHIEKDILLYMNFAVANYWQERSLVARLFQNESYCVVAYPKDYYSYLVDMARSKFVLSPRGNGIDCHRTWEALLMGAIPIVKSSYLDPLFEQLPVLIVDDWHQVTQEFLEAKYEEINSREYELERVYCFYWLDLIQNERMKDEL